MAKKRKQHHRTKPAAKPAAPTAKTDATKTDAAKTDAAKSESAKSEATKTEAAKPAASSLPAAATVEPSRGKQRRDALRKDRDKHQREAVYAGAPVEEPAFFFGYEVRWAKLVLARVVVFMLLAYDALMQIEHAPRYGAGGFNVAQLPLLGAIAPGRELYDVGQLVSAYLLVLAACGVATRVVLPIATAIYGWLYFGSHLDSYQHHYLVFLLLLLSCFVPWQRPPDAVPGTRVRSWAIRLILIQVGLLYFWAAISKINPAWLDGKTLGTLLLGAKGIKSLVDSTIGIKAMSVLVILTELALAFTVWSRRTAWIAAPIGIGLHVGILFTGLEIGVFAVFMLGLYILVIPDGVWVWIAELPPLRTLRNALGVVSSWFHGSLRFVVWIVAATAGAVLAMLSRFDHGPGVGLWLVIALVVGTVFAFVRKRTHVAWLAIAHLLAFVMWTSVDRFTDTAPDYFRLWGGSSLRLGDPKTAEAAYRRMTEIAPDNPRGFYQLGKILLQREAAEEGLTALRRAQTLEPLKARSYVAEARYLASHGKRDEAIAKAREATIVDPTDHEAKTLLDSLLSAP